MWEALTLLGIGLAVGVPSALRPQLLPASQLFGVKSNDVLTVTTALAILAIVAVGAGFLPAPRASAVDPIQALRYE
jgi:ABC-type lipoprotein release transport system permease subunit